MFENLTSQFGIQARPRELRRDSQAFWRLLVLTKAKFTATDVLCGGVRGHERLTPITVPPAERDREQMLKQMTEGA
jgi:hypothetical protein